MDDEPLERVLTGALRFRAFLGDVDVALEPEAPRDGGRRTIARDRSGGAYVLVDAGDAELAVGVWWLGSEGQRSLLAPDVRTLFLRLGEGSTPDDLARGRETPTGRRAPGLLRWAATLP